MGSIEEDSKPRKGGDRVPETVAGIVTMLVVDLGHLVSADLTLTSRDWSRVQKLLRGRFDVCIYIWGVRESSGWGRTQNCQVI